MNNDLKEILHARELVKREQRAKDALKRAENCILQADIIESKKKADEKFEREMAERKERLSRLPREPSTVYAKCQHCNTMVEIDNLQGCKFVDCFFRFRQCPKCDYYVVDYIKIDGTANSQYEPYLLKMIR